MAKLWKPIFILIVFLSLVDSLTFSSIKKYLTGIFIPSQIRVIGGSNAVPGQFPYQVLIRIVKKGGQFICGGSLISDSHVLTAAHCVQDVDYLFLTFGSVTTSAFDATETQFVMKSQIRTHPFYTVNDVKNDLAILTLAVPVKLNSYVKPVLLPESQYVESRDAILTGWGRTSDGIQGVSTRVDQQFFAEVVDLTKKYSRYSSSILKYARMELMPIYSCIFYWNSMGVPVDETQLCTKYVGTGTASCNGDSGGPLVEIDNFGRFTQIGVVSFGVNLCESDTPSVYTRIGSFLPWIKSTTGI